MCVLSDEVGRGGTGVGSARGRVEGGVVNGVPGRGHRDDACPDADDTAALDGDVVSIDEASSRFL